MDKKDILKPANHELKSDSQDKATNKRIHEHIAHENDTITDNDIKNAKTDITNLAEKDNDDETKDKESKNDQSNNLKDNTNPTIQSVWNILESE